MPPPSRPSLLDCHLRISSSDRRDQSILRKRDAHGGRWAGPNENGGRRKGDGPARHVVWNGFGFILSCGRRFPLTGALSCCLSAHPPVHYNDATGRLSQQQERKAPPTVSPCQDVRRTRRLLKTWRPANIPFRLSVCLPAKLKKRLPFYKSNKQQKIIVNN